jgi:hypothetical protein
MLFISLALILPWSLWRQMHTHEISRRELPLHRGDIPSTAAAAGAARVSLALSVGLGLRRGAVVPVRRDAHDRPFSKGNRVTIALWTLLIALEVALAAVGSLTGWYALTGAGEVFVFFAISFAAQNLVVAWRAARMAVPA